MCRLLNRYFQYLVLCWDRTILVWNGCRLFCSLKRLYIFGVLQKGNCSERLFLPVTVIIMKLCVYGKIIVKKKRWWFFVLFWLCSFEFPGSGANHNNIIIFNYYKDLGLHGRRDRAPNVGPWHTQFLPVPVGPKPC